MSNLITLLQHDIPEGKQNLIDSYVNLEKVADYCEENYFQADKKNAALQETRGYAIQSLASVAYQINTLACNFLRMLDLQSNQLQQMKMQIRHIAQNVIIHKEKVARREIGVLTTNKVPCRQHKIIRPPIKEKPIVYSRKPIDYSILDDVGHGVKLSNISKRGTSLGNGMENFFTSGPAPTTKPPTPPQNIRLNMGTIGKQKSEYRVPPAVPPPQVPSHYAPNFPFGYRRFNDRGSGYSTLPLPQNRLIGAGMQSNNLSQSSFPSEIHNTPYVYNSGHYSLHHQSMPPPPSPLLTVEDYEIKSGNISPPLPPPPSVDDDGNIFSPESNLQSRDFSDEVDDAVSWIPENYIEKVVAVYDYEANKDDELTFQENSVIYVLNKNQDGWWEGVMDGVTGLFPSNYVEPCL